MGYVHDTQMIQQISPFQFAHTSGTWTPTVSTNLVSSVRTATAATGSTIIPITLPQNSGTAKGAYLVSIDVFYKVATANLNGVATVQLAKDNWKVSGTAIDVTTISSTPDSAHNTSALRYAIGDHSMTVAIDSPVWMGAGDLYILRIDWDAAATSVLTFFGARANYTLRI
jgi:hypothetical protein